MPTDLKNASDQMPLKTVPYDPRFPNTNQTQHCYTSYLDYHRCIKKRGKDYPACKYYEDAYQALCPNGWYEKWDDQIQNGTFPGKI